MESLQLGSHFYDLFFEELAFIKTHRSVAADYTLWGMNLFLPGCQSEVTGDKVANEKM